MKAKPSQKKQAEDSKPKVVGVQVIEQAILMKPTRNSVRHPIWQTLLRFIAKKKSSFVQDLSTLHN